MDVENNSSTNQTIRAENLSSNAQPAISGYSSGQFPYAAVTGTCYGTCAGVGGDSTGGNGVSGAANASGVSGVYGYNGASGAYGVAGRSGVNGRAIYGDNTCSGSGCSGYAGEFHGRVYVSGYLTKAGGGFLIDHPLDPSNRVLYHSFVESPDMKNVYDGIVVVGASGEATVTLPAWFEALNSDYRYQLTPIGQPSNPFIKSEVKAGVFTIAGGKPGQKISWQVTGIRQDAFARSQRLPVDEPKSADTRGKYLNPEAFGLPDAMGISAPPASLVNSIRSASEPARRSKK